MTGSCSRGSSGVLGVGASAVPGTGVGISVWSCSRRPWRMACWEHFVVSSAMCGVSGAASTKEVTR
jgi:hypothetical protein